MSSERRSVEGYLPDGVVPEGAEQNPNPPEQVVANRARFEEKQRALQHDRQEASEQIREVQAQLEAQYQESMRDPEHQAFIPEQIAHELNEPFHAHGGQEDAGRPHIAGHLPQNPDVVDVTPLPTTPRAAEELRGAGQEPGVRG